jgi:hypothetical protein
MASCNGRGHPRKKCQALQLQGSGTQFPQFFGWSITVSRTVSYSVHTGQSVAWKTSSSLP